MKICINAGHAPNGNPDPGACNKYTGLKESDVVDDVAQDVMYFLEQAGYEVLVVQNDSLQAICDASNAFGADLFLSIHCNASDNESATGTEIWTSKGETEGDVLATSIMNRITKAFPDLALRADFVDGDVDKESNFFVVRYTDAPACLVELAFITNADDEALLANAESKQNFAKAIALGVSDYAANI